MLIGYGLNDVQDLQNKAAKTALKWPLYSSATDALVSGSAWNNVYRGYYMAARRYEITLRVLKNIHYINTNELPNHFTLIVFLV